MKKNLRPWLYVWTLVAFGVCPLWVGSSFAKVEKATYEAKDGDLKIVSLKPDSFKFEINTASNMGDLCSIEAGVAKKKSDSYWFTDEEGCQIEFRSTTPGTIHLKINDSCGDYCGVSASFGEEFRIRRPACSASQIQAARNAFQKDYHQKKYNEAFKGLEAVVTSCKFFIPDTDLANDRGDLAISAFHAGDKEKCLQQIKVARQENPNLETGALEDLPSSPVYTSLKKSAKALSFNEAKCSAK